MFNTKKELRDCIRLESELYCGNRKLEHFLAHSKNYIIFRYMYFLRNEEFYSGTSNLAGKFLYLFFKRRKNMLGQKLGFDIPANCVESGFHIFHVGGGSY